MTVRRVEAGHGNQERKYQTAIAALMTAPRQADAAAAAGISERTLERWMVRPDFRRLYRAARSAAVEQAVSQLQTFSSSAVAVLVEVMQDTAAPPAVRVAAASKVLAGAVEALEMMDFAGRLEALESKVNDEPDTASATTGHGSGRSGQIRRAG